MLVEAPPTLVLWIKPVFYVNLIIYPQYLIILATRKLSNILMTESYDTWAVERVEKKFENFIALIFYRYAFGRAVIKNFN